jgi:hypothetical protein
VGDIDWKAFVHESKTDCMRQMWFEERGTSGDLDQVWVACECGAQRAMSQAARMDLQSLGRCNGSRPWLGAGTRESCGQPNKLLIRSASNAYFPQLLSVISIPNVRKPVDDVVASLWADYLDEVETAEDLSRIRRKPTPAARLQEFTDVDVFDAVQRKRQGDNGAGRSVKDVEFEALTDAREEMGADTVDEGYPPRGSRPPVARGCRPTRIHTVRGSGPRYSGRAFSWRATGRTVDRV